MAYQFIPKKVGDWTLVEKNSGPENVAVIYQYKDRELYVAIEKRDERSMAHVFIEDGVEPEFDFSDLMELFYKVNAGLSMDVKSVEEVYEGNLDLARLYVGAK